MANEKGIKKYPCGKRTVVLDWGDGHPPDFNLWVEDENGKEAWRMNKVVRFPDAAVLVDVDSDLAFRFTTWNGLRFTIDINTFEVVGRDIAK